MIRSFKFFAGIQARFFMFGKGIYVRLCTSYAVNSAVKRTYHTIYGARRRREKPLELCETGFLMKKVVWGSDIVVKWFKVV